MEKISGHGSCFVCGTENPHSTGLVLYKSGDGTIYAEMIFNLSQQGPPGHVHGGASAAVLDEAMGAAVWVAGHHAAAVNLEINYRKPIPLDQKIIIKAEISVVHPRKILTTSKMILPDGEIAVVGKGIYVEAPHLFVDSEFTGKS